MSSSRRRAPSRKAGAARPSGVSGAELLARSRAILRKDRFHCRSLGAEQRLDLRLLGESSSCSLRISISSSLRKGAQAHVEDRLGLDVGQLEARDQLRLRLILVADDADHLVEVEIGDQVARRAPPAAARSRPGGSASGAPARRGDGRAIRAAPRAAPSRAARVPRDSTFMLSEMRRFELGQPEQRLHQQLGIDGAALGLEDEADVLGEFVAHVVDQRQLALAISSSAIFSISRDFCTW